MKDLTHRKDIFFWDAGIKDIFSDISWKILIDGTIIFFSAERAYVQTFEYQTWWRKFWSGPSIKDILAFGQFLTTPPLCPEAQVIFIRASVFSWPSPLFYRHPLWMAPSQSYASEIKRTKFQEKISLETWNGHILKTRNA